jgi:hypothetical protein
MYNVRTPKNIDRVSPTVRPIEEEILSNNGQYKGPPRYRLMPYGKILIHQQVKPKEQHLEQQSKSLIPYTNIEIGNGIVKSIVIFFLQPCEEQFNPNKEKKKRDCEEYVKWIHGSVLCNAKLRNPNFISQPL